MIVECIYHSGWRDVDERSALRHCNVWRNNHLKHKDRRHIAWEGRQIWLEGANAWPVSKCMTCVTWLFYMLFSMNLFHFTCPVASSSGYFRHGWMDGFWGCTVSFCRLSRRDGSPGSSLALKEICVHVAAHCTHINICTDRGTVW